METVQSLWTLTMVFVSTVVTSAGIWVFEGRRRARQQVAALEHSINGRLRRDASLSGLRVVPRPQLRSWVGDIDLSLDGVVSSDAERSRVLAIADEELGRLAARARVVDRLRIAPPRAA